MKLIEKFLIKRCSTEVQIMLERMEQRPEDFNYGTGWRALVEKAEEDRAPYTTAERNMIRKYWKRCEYVRKRNELLSRIMSETINPTTRESIEDTLFNKRYAQALSASMQNTTQIIQGGIASAYTDPRAMYGSNSGAQGAYANPHSRNPFQSSTAP